MAQTQPAFSKYPVDPGYLPSFDGAKIDYEFPGEGKPLLRVHGLIVNSHSWKGTSFFSELLKDRYKVINPAMRGNGYSVVGYARGSIITVCLFVLDNRMESAVPGGAGADCTNPRWLGRNMLDRALMGDSVPGLKGAVAYVRKQSLNQRVLAYLQKERSSTGKEELPKISKPLLINSCDKDSDNGSSHELAALVPHSSVATTPGDHNHATEQKNFRMKS